MAKLRSRLNRYYGWRPDLPDHRDYRRLLRLAASAIPAKADLSPIFGDAWPCFDQGELGSCTANAIGGALLFDQIKQSLAAPFVPSRLFIYYNERVIEGTVDEDAGAEIRDGIKSVATLGAPPEIPPVAASLRDARTPHRGVATKATRSSSCWPYVISKFDVKPNAACYRRAKAHPAVLYERVDQNEVALRGCIASGSPFVFGFTVYKDFESDRVARTGAVNMPKPSEGVLGGHAVLAVGYDDSTKRFLCRNSWASDWAINGYFTIPYGYLTDNNLSDDFWVITQTK